LPRRGGQRRIVVDQHQPDLPVDADRQLQVAEHVGEVAVGKLR
jgi:hypothetical protein